LKFLKRTIMLRTLFTKKNKTSIGLDKSRGKYYAIRLEFHKDGPRITNLAETDRLEPLSQQLEAADIVVTRPPLDGFFNRRVIRVEGDWTDDSNGSFSERGYAVYKHSQASTPVSMDEVVYGWKVLAFDSGQNKTEIEVHQSGGVECAQMLKPLQALGLGPIQLEALHSTALDCVIPEKFKWYILETRSPDGFCLVRDSKLIAHIGADVFTSPSADRLHVDTLRHFLKSYQESGQPGLLQAFFLNPKSPHIRGLSCSWVGDNCAELVDTPVGSDYLQALGLAMSWKPEWWLHHISEFYRKG
jgi:hypothetical protein